MNKVQTLVERGGGGEGVALMHQYLCNLDSGVFVFFKFHLPKTVPPHFSCIVGPQLRLNIGCRIDKLNIFKQNYAEKSAS